MSQLPTPHQYQILTFGCQMNKNDSERLESIFRGMNMLPTDSSENADVIIMNSCSVRQKAEDKMYGMARNFAHLKKRKPNLIVGITGCMPGRDADGRMKKKLQGVDLFFPTQDMVFLPKWLGELNPSMRMMEDLDKDYLALRPTIQKKSQAFVTLQTGCNHFCTYCVVPFARGLERNRPLRHILDEANHLARGGCVEITLLGQIVNHYIAPDPRHWSTQNPYVQSDFARLLWEINQIDGIERIHWTAPHPIFMTDEVIDALTLPKQVNFLHLPVQSGSNAVLKRMNRRHTREMYIDLIATIREKIPHIALGTDIIVGFCGETKEQFEETVDLYKTCNFDISYTAQYSTRSGTLAKKIFHDDVSRDEKKRRWWVLQKIMEETVLKKNQLFVDSTVSVMVEECSAGWCTGNSNEMKRVRFKGDPPLVGSIVPVQIFKAEEWMLHGIKN
ncbi:MAG: tRNA (N6-isopentenyl adenosine(37)-C2)-methylthiotransferase MiaB [Candidatus Magasanikbacteria bacterium CG10_big_fil_rev_8_21_14_0_10_47_10]|uniref:tRNA-2-methylthio-N(6)-dimethylallyladenosine synthase n=1 Tax=Candidatus Magasanikbacteria bacterium CG10_big_fil_rev_8_21_14_0_10_47_10 TaxID=1974652 RepID=A0A2H0TQA7_9BACT|nr:MAG: tRNA (N6-isopentenyl adenosine(37)-C2)-methylthiotransferase MiaB [Candidatus Magasanikbacteria bacterium CG10_big_fil_rev_8_21_14_0_10_47_10]